MTKNSFQFIFKFLIVFYSVNVFAFDMKAVVVNPIKTADFSIGIGSTVNLLSNDLTLSGESLFLGNAFKGDGSPAYQIYLNKNSKKVYFIESDHFSKNSNFQSILDPSEQVGGTCAAYAINHFMLQAHLSGFQGTGALTKTLSTEEGRTTLLADSINKYYLNMHHRSSTNGILNTFGKTFGFKCKYIKAETYEEAKEKILAQLKIGSPVVVSFYLGPNMVKSPFQMISYDQKNSEIDDRLWIPRKIGERNSGGHSIVATASFELNHTTYLVMLDSDWSEPRIWDMDAFMGQRTRIEETELVTCK